MRLQLTGSFCVVSDKLISRLSRSLDASLQATPVTSSDAVARVVAIGRVYRVLQRACDKELNSRHSDVTARCLQLVVKTLLKPTLVDEAESCDSGQKVCLEFMEILLQSVSNVGSGAVTAVRAVLADEVLSSSEFLELVFRSKHVCEFLCVLHKAVSVCIGISAPADGVTSNVNRAETEGDAASSSSDEMATDDDGSTSQSSLVDFKDQLKAFYGKLFECTGFIEIMQDDTKQREQGTSIVQNLMVVVQFLNFWRLTF